MSFINLNNEKSRKNEKITRLYVIKTQNLTRDNSQDIFN